MSDKLPKEIQDLVDKITKTTGTKPNMNVVRLGNIEDNDEYDTSNGSVPSKRIPEILAKLHEFYKDATSPINRFSPGDLVTPRKGSGLNTQGQPAIVLEVFNQPIRTVASSNERGAYAKCDMRVLAYQRGTSPDGKPKGAITDFLVQSWQYEKYLQPPKQDDKIPVNKDILETKDDGPRAN